MLTDAAADAAMVNGPEDDLLAWNAIDWQACKEKSGCGSGSSRRPEQDWPQGQDLQRLMQPSRYNTRAARLADDIDPGHAEGLPPIPQVSLIPFRPSWQLDPMVLACIVR
jgi:hypothetical protein